MAVLVPDETCCVLIFDLKEKIEALSGISAAIRRNARICGGLIIDIVINEARLGECTGYTEVP